MGTSFKRIAILGNPADQAALDTVDAVVKHLASAGVDVLVSDKLPEPAAPAARSPVADDQIAGKSDLVIAIGGDGTMLYAARQAFTHDVPVLGINRGRLGFLADIKPEEISESINAVLAGEFSSEKRMLLKVEILQGEKVVSAGVAVNDVVIKRRETARMLEYQTIVDGVYVNTHGGDGFVAATPTGSTAYALSCGGPIIEPSMDALVLAPICPHTLADRPIVIPGRSVTEVRLLQNHGTNADVSGDGELIGELEAGEHLRIVVADQTIELIHPPGYDYFGVLRSKLYWGRDTRDRQPPRD
ncbi:MAG: NAD(+) kinase [Gammaproteobacteria bacterium]|jgi:NAD+ kinase|nr:NAD(+) kinase [Gammaproteobacteria bacterium]MDP6615724.1 NAD(+) kinase [Gammaproteobacteria bacterium]MDP6695265.1 NAD(+) kinase [Gammaproteobacteria bacterium]MDP7041834.1 NAD(+) kinase [Gammaproteobacteria bacterium]